MKKLLKIAIRIAGLLTIGGAIVGYKDHLDNKKEGRKPRTIYEDGIKRGLDWMCGMAAIIFFWPLYLIVAVLVRINLGSPVIFTQERPGRDEKIFKLYKFRTMTDEKDDNGEPMPDEVRLTRFGKALRSSSMDELPELLNILKGDMAIVGPRPLLVKYLTYYTEEQHRRHSIRPGLTGYAQIHGRNTVNWDERFSMDVNYTEKITFIGDVKIVLKTIGKVIKREGISSNSSVTMEDFRDYCVNVGRNPGENKRYNKQGGGYE